METQFIKVLPALIIDVIGSVIAFGIGLAWWKASGRELDRTAVVFMAKMFGGIAIAGMILAFIM